MLPCRAEEPKEHGSWTLNRRLPVQHHAQASALHCLTADNRGTGHTERPPPRMKAAASRRASAAPLAARCQVPRADHQVGIQNISDLARQTRPRLAPGPLAEHADDNPIIEVGPTRRADSRVPRHLGQEVHVQVLLEGQGCGAAMPSYLQSTWQQ